MGEECRGKRRGKSFTAFRLAILQMKSLSDRGVIFPAVLLTNIPEFCKDVVLEIEVAQGDVTWDAALRD